MSEKELKRKEFIEKTDAFFSYLDVSLDDAIFQRYADEDTFIDAQLALIRLRTLVYRRRITFQSDYNRINS